MRISDWSSDVCSSDLCRACRGTRCSDGEAAPQARVALEFSGFCRWILLPSRTTPRGVVFTRKPRQPQMLGSYLPGRPQDVVASRVSKLTLPRGEVNRWRRVNCDGVPGRRRRHGDGESGRPGGPANLQGIGLRAELHCQFKGPRGRSEEPTSELQSLMRISYALFCLKKNNNTTTT